MLPESPLTTAAERLKERILSLPVTEEPFKDDMPSGLTPEDVEYYHALAFDWRSNPVPILRSAVRKHPDFPPLYTYLLEAYRKKGLRAKEDELVGEMEKRFPNYLFTRLAMAKKAMYEEDGAADAMQAALGGHLDLDELYPERAVFHFVEVWQFYLMVGLIHCERGDAKLARGILAALEELGADGYLLDTLDTAIKNANYQRFLAMQEEEDQLVRVTPTPLPEDPVPAGPLVLNHEEARILVENGLGMPEEALVGLLALPPETFTRDLVAILEHCRENAPYLWVEDVEADIPGILNIVLLLMAETKARGVVGTVLEFFALHPSAFHLYLDELDRISVPLATILQDGIEEALVWLRRPGIDCFNKLYLTEALGQLAHREPACRARIARGLADLVSFMLECDPDDNVTDSVVISAMVQELAHLRAKEHLPLIEQAFQREIVAKSYVGDLDDIKSTLLSTEPPPAALPVLSVLEINRRYSRARDGWEVDDDDDGGGDEPGALPPPGYGLENPPAPGYLSPDHEVGRNDPCPCGSGKKYKKCCLR